MATRRPSSPRSAGRLCVAALLAVAGATATTPVHASDEDIAIASAVGVLGAIDVGFGVYDLVVLAEKRDVSTEAATAQLLATGLQSNALHIAIIGMAQDRQRDAVFVLTFPTMLTTALASHASWSLAARDTDPRTIVLGSSIIGVNQAYTVAALAHAAAGEPSPLPTAIGQIITSIPTLGTSAYMLSQDGGFRSGWMFLTAWSSGVLIHGAVSLFNQRDSDSSNDSALAPSAGPWQIDAAPMLSISPDIRGNLAPTVGISGRL